MLVYKLKLVFLCAKHRLRIPGPVCGRMMNNGSTTVEMQALRYYFSKTAHYSNLIIISSAVFSFVNCVVTAAAPLSTLYIRYSMCEGMYTVSDIFYYLSRLILHGV